MTNDPPSLLVERDGPAVTILIDRPARRNALDLGTVDHLGALVDELADDPAIAVVVVRGSGETFSAGADAADLNALVAMDDAELDALFAEQLAVLGRIGAAPFVTVAGVDGVALGWAVALAAACDVVVATRRARFGLPEVRLGMAPAMVLTTLLSRVRSGSAIELAAGGQQIDAEQAAAIGLVDRVVGDDQLDDALAQVVAALAVASPDAVRATVALTRRLARGEAVDLPAESRSALRSPPVAGLVARLGGARP